MATRKHAQYAAHVAQKMAKRHGVLAPPRVTRVGRGWGLQGWDIEAPLPGVIAGVRVRAFSERALFRTHPWRRIRRKRRPRPELLYRSAFARVGFFPEGQNKQRRERARYRKRQATHG